MDEHTICRNFLANPDYNPERPTNKLRKGMGPYNNYVKICRDLAYNDEIDQLLGIKQKTYLTQFLFDSEILNEFTMGDCKIFATKFIEKYGGELIGIGSDFHKEWLKNPGHYLVKYKNYYIDATGVFRSFNAMIKHYNIFYKRGLTNMNENLEMKLWPIKTKSDSKCNDDAIKRSIEFIKSLHPFENMFYQLKSGHDMNFVITDDIDDIHFSYATEIVFNAENYINSQGKIISKIKDEWIDVNGILHNKPLSLPKINISQKHKLNNEILKRAIKIASSIEDDRNILDVWHFETTFPDSSTAALLLKHIDYMDVKYPFLGAFMNSSLSDSIKQKLLHGQIIEAIASYLPEEKIHKLLFLTGELHTLIYSKFNNSLDIDVFMNANLEDNEHRYVQKMIRLKRKYELKTKLNVMGYEDIFYKTSKWNILLTKIIWFMLKDFSVPEMIFVRNENLIAYKQVKITYLKDKNLLFGSFIYTYGMLEKNLNDINERFNFYFGIDSLDQLIYTIDNRILLLDFKNSFIQTDDFEIITERVTDIYNIVYDALNLDVYEYFDDHKSIVIDLKMFCYLSRKRYNNNDIIKFCDHVLNGKYYTYQDIMSHYFKDYH